jgi:hypothetical protein
MTGWLVLSECTHLGCRWLLGSAGGGQHLLKCYDGRVRSLHESRHTAGGVLDAHASHATMLPLMCPGRKHISSASEQAKQHNQQEQQLPLQ